MMIDEEPWFVAKDICDALGYVNHQQAVLKNTDPKQRNSVSLRDGIRGNPNKTIVSEGGLYSLILSSKLPEAKKFKLWVTDDVIPAIRKTGAYVKGEEALKEGKPLPEDTMKAMEDRLNAKFEQLFTMNQQLIQANTGLKEDVTRKQFVIEEMHDKMNTLSEDKAALESVKAEMEPLVEKYRDFLDMDGTLNKSAAAPLLGFRSAIMFNRWLA